MSTAAIIIVDPPEDFDETTFSPDIEYVLVLDKGTHEPECPSRLHDWLAVIRNSGGKSSILYRAHVADVLLYGSDIDPVAVYDSRPRYADAWQLPTIEPRRD